MARYCMATTCRLCVALDFGYNICTKLYEFLKGEIFMSLNWEGLYDKRARRSFKRSSRLTLIWFSCESSIDWKQSQALRNRFNAINTNIVALSCHCWNHWNYCHYSWWGRLQGGFLESLVALPWRIWTTPGHELWWIGRSWSLHARWKTYQGSWHSFSVVPLLTVVNLHV